MIRRDSGEENESPPERVPHPVQYNIESSESIEIIEEGLINLMPNSKAETFLSPTPIPNTTSGEFRQDKSSDSLRKMEVENPETSNEQHSNNRDPKYKGKQERHLPTPKNQRAEGSNSKMEGSFGSQITQKENEHQNHPNEYPGLEDFSLTSTKTDPNWDKPRFVIESIIMNNFKTFSDKCEMTGMRSGYNAVVGANGSGKSNLMDALLFVFGCNSHMMRHDKNIFLVSNNVNASSGYVEIVFHVTPKTHPEEKFTYTTERTKRTMRRTIVADGSTTFQIDGEVLNAKDAKAYLFSLGIDLHQNRFLIQQGQVERITMMNPKGNKTSMGMLEYLQETIGTREYATRMQELKPELEEAREKENSRNEEIVALRQFLIKDEENMNEGLVYYNNLKKYMKLTDLTIESELHKIKEQSLKLADGIAYIESENEKVAGSGDRMVETQQMIEEENPDLKQHKVPYCSFQRLERVRNIVVKKCSNIDREIRELEQRNNFNKTEISSLIKDLDSEMEKLQRLALKEQQSKFQYKLGDLVYPNLLNQIEIMKRKVSHLKKKLHQNGNMSNFTTDFIQNFEGMRKIKENIQKIDNQRLNILENIDKFEENIRKGKEEIQGKQPELEELAGRREMCQEALTVIEGKYKETLLQSDQLNRRCHEEKKRQLEIEEIFRSKKEVRTKMATKNTLAQRIEMARIPGVYGRLGSLGECTPEFDQLITSTVFQLDNIVVKDHRAGEKVIELVKREGLGRVTCIVLDMIRKNQYYMNKQFKAVPNAVRLFDQVKPVNDDARLAFYFAMRDALFVQNPDKLFQVATSGNEKRRVICYSKAGTIIIRQRNGLMSSQYIKRGGFGATLRLQPSNDNQTRQLQAQLHKERQKNMILQEQKRAMLTQINTIYNQKSYVLKEITHLQMQMKRIKDTVYSITTYTIRKNEEGITEMERKMRGAEERLENEREGLRVLQERDEKGKLGILSSVGFKSLYVWRLMSDYEHEIKMMRKEIARIEEGRKLTEARKQSFIKQKEPNRKRIQFILKQLNKLKQSSRELIRKGQGLISRKLMLIYQYDILEKTTVPRWIVTKIKEFKGKLNENQDISQMISGSTDSHLHLKSLTKKMLRKSHEYLRTHSYLERVRRIWRDSEKEYGFLDEVSKWPIFKSSNRCDEEYSLKCMRFMEKPQKGKQSIVYPNLTHSQNINVETLEIIATLHSELVEEWKESMKLLNISKHKQERALNFRGKYLLYKEKEDSMTELTKKKEALIEQLQNLYFTRLTKFNEGFDPIVKQLKRIYSELSLSGDISMMSINNTNPFESGVLIRAKPPKKGWREMNKLSGGEKTLTSLSLIFALQAYKPSPIYLLDEIDAALDVRNTEIVSKFIKRQSTYSQFIVISLRTDTFSNCDDMVGIIKFGNNATNAVLAPCLPSGINQSKYPSLRLQLQSQNILIIENRDSASLSDILDPRVTEVLEKESDTTWNKLEGSQRKRFIWNNLLEYPCTVNDLWLRRNGWHWKPQDISLKFLQSGHKIYWVKFIGGRENTMVVEESKELVMTLDELELTREEKEIVKSGKSRAYHRKELRAAEESKEPRRTKAE